MAPVAIINVCTGLRRKPNIRREKSEGGCEGLNVVGEDEVGDDVVSVEVGDKVGVEVGDEVGVEVGDEVGVEVGGSVDRQPVTVVSSTGQKNDMSPTMSFPLMVK